jgi:hypothetical protein
MAWAMMKSHHKDLLSPCGLPAGRAGPSLAQKLALWDACPDLQSVQEADTA